MTPELDRQFAALAEENIRLHPIRYYLLLPAARMLDMWFRPRTEMMPLDTHFWEIEADPHDAWCGIALGAAQPCLRGRRSGRGMADAPPHQDISLCCSPTRSCARCFWPPPAQSEDRYTMECFPFVLGAGRCISGLVADRRRAQRTRH